MPKEFAGGSKPTGANLVLDPLLHRTRQRNVNGSSHGTNHTSRWVLCQVVSQSGRGASKLILSEANFLPSIRNHHILESLRHQTSGQGFCLIHFAVHESHFANLACQGTEKAHEITLVGVAGKAIHHHHLGPQLPHSVVDENLRLLVDQEIPPAIPPLLSPYLDLQATLFL